MAKAFKIIMNILMILLVAALCAVFVPPFVGITTAVASGSESNIPTGAIVYATREALENLEVGENILITSDNSSYIYEITEIDETNKALTVRTSESSETEVVQLSRAATKIVIVVPLLGFILLALQSFVGFIILAVTCALIIILFIIATVLKNQAESDEDEEDFDEEDDDTQYFQGLAAGASKPSELDKLGTFSLPDLDGVDVGKTQEIIVDPVPLDEETKEFSKLMFDSVDEPPSAPQNELTGTTEDEPTYEQEVEPEGKLEDEQKEKSEDWHIDEIEYIPDENESEPVGSITAELLSQLEAFEASFRQEEGKQEEGNQEEIKQEEIKQEEIKQEESKLEESKPEDIPASEPETRDAAPASDIKEPIKSNVTEVALAIPIRSLDELLEEAYGKGEDPHVVKDDVTGISFVDYSSCF